MKIGINARFLVHPFTGIGQYTRNLVRAMAKLKPENEYYLFTPELVDISLPSNCKQIRVAERPYRSASLRKTHWEHVLVPREMENLQVRIAHFPYPCNPWHRLPMTTIVTVHDVIPWILPEYRQKFRTRLYYWYARWALRKADHLITVSHFSKDEMVKYLRIPSKKIAVITEAAPLVDEPLSFPDLNLRRKFFLYVGGFDERKNVPFLIRAFQKFIAPLYSVDLIVVGGKGKDLERFVTDEYCERVAGRIPLKAKGKVIFTETLPQSELQCLYKHALALTHISEYEGFNLALVEAMNAGIPIIASDIPVHREVAGKAALYVEPHDINSIGNGMHQLLHDRQLQKNLAHLSSERSKSFSWEQAAEDTLYIYSLFT